MPQRVCRIPGAFARSLAQSLRSASDVVDQHAKGDAIYVGRIDNDRIEIRDEGTITYGGTPRAEAVLIQGIKGVLPPPPARYVLGIDEAGIGGESAKPHVAVVLLSTDLRATLYAQGVRDCKSVNSQDELERLATLISENAAHEQIVPLDASSGEPFATQAARAASKMLQQFFMSGFTTHALAIRMDATDRATFEAELGSTWPEIKSITSIETSGESHIEVAAASILAKRAASAHATTPKNAPKAKTSPATAAFTIGPWKPEDKEQIVHLLRGLHHSYPDIGSWIDKGGAPAGIWDRIAAGKYKLVVARVGSEVAGFSLTQRKDARNWKMSTFFVAPAYRARNIGPRLLKEEIQHLARDGVRRLMVTFGHEEFAQMQSFFTKYGFTCDGISPQRYRDNSYEVIMGKRFSYSTVNAENFLEFIQHDAFRMAGYDIQPVAGDYFFALPKQALFAIHQLRPERRYLVKATTSPTPEADLPDLRKEAKKHDAHPVLAALYGLPAEDPLPNDVLVLDAFELENQFYPIHLERPDSQDLVIPIKPKFASLLFPDKKQSTLGVSKFALREDHVYYRVDKGAKNLRRGARLFWYVSSPKQQIIGSARLRSIDRGAPTKLWHRYGGLGAWNEDDIEDHTSGENAMVFVFEWFRESPSKPTIAQVKSIRPAFYPISIVALLHAEGDKLLDLAGIK